MYVCACERKRVCVWGGVGGGGGGGGRACVCLCIHRAKHSAYIHLLNDSSFLLYNMTREYLMNSVNSAS